MFQYVISCSIFYCFDFFMVENSGDGGVCETVKVDSRDEPIKPKVSSRDSNYFE
jgi:hypothetical protein